MWTCLLFIAVPGVAQPEICPPPSQVLHLHDLETIALRHNPTLVQAGSLVSSAQGKALQAGLCPNPTLGYTGEQIGASGTAGELQGGFVQQLLVTGGKLRLSRAKYRQETYEAEIQRWAQEMRVVNGIRLHYIEMLCIQRRIEILERLCKNADEWARTHKEMANTGQASQSDLLIAEADAQRALIALHAAENHRSAIWESLTAILGVPGMPMTPLAGSLECDSSTLAWDESWQRLLSESPELQFAHAHVVHDQIALRREMVEPIPNVNVQLASGYDYESRNAVAGVQIGLNLPVWDRNQGSIQQARADLTHAHAEVRRVELSLRKRLAEAYREYQTARMSVELQGKGVLPKSKKAYETQHEMYKKRRAPWVEVVSLERNWLSQEEQYIRMLCDLRKSETVINGLLLVDGLTPPQMPEPPGHREATPRPR